MKRAILIMLAILAAQAATVARAETSSYTVVLAGGAELSMIHIWLTPDGRSYVIDSAAPLEVGGTVCEHSAGNPDELVCQAALVAGFEINAGPGNDSVVVSSQVTIPVTMRGGPGDDNDRLIGKGGNDLIFGGPGNDTIYGGSGEDTLRGGPGNDVISGGSGVNNIRQDMRPQL
jgi:hypothetical protein